MKIAEINMLTNGSTGKIMFQIAEKAREEENMVHTYSPVPFVRGKKNQLENIPNHFWWGSRFEAKFHYYVGSIFGLNGSFSYFGTRSLIKHLKKFAPDIIHLHNLHGFCLNLPMLFNYIKKSGVKVIWTLHDCWAFTGHCPYFDMVGCEKWKTGCYKCPQPKIYPKMYLDTSRVMYYKKKKWLSALKSLTIVTPSQWLAERVKQSFLSEYDIKVINNGIDISVFKPRESDFRKKYNIEEKYILLGVSFDWGKRKGLDVFKTLAEKLDSNRYQIVLVGTNDNIDAQLPSNIISIHRTYNQIELAEIYSAADLFINPTREDNYPTVNMEAIACGTPVITFKTGGSPEIPDDLTGVVVDCDNIAGIEQEITRITNEAIFHKKDCLQRAKLFDKQNCFEKYVELFNLINQNERV